MSARIVWVFVVLAVLALAVMGCVLPVRVVL